MTNERSWKERELDYMNYFYGDLARKFDNKGYNDDRQLYANLYNQLIEAISSLRKNPHVTVCVAMNQYLDKIRTEYLDPIKKKYNEGLWEGRM